MVSFRLQEVTGCLVFIFLHLSTVQTLDSLGSCPLTLYEGQLLQNRGQEAPSLAGHWGWACPFLKGYSSRQAADPQPAAPSISCFSGCSWVLDRFKVSPLFFTPSPDDC